MFRVTAHLPAATAKGLPFDSITLAPAQRRLRDGRLVGIIAADEAVYEIRGRDAAHIARLAWHIGNRHLPAQIEKSRILIGRDRIIRDMLVGLGAEVIETVAHFSPEHGAYSHDHGGGHALNAR